MAGRIELESDIAIKLGEPAYYSIAGNEVSDMSARPYFRGSVYTQVKLNGQRNTVLQFKIGGRAGREIHGQVQRPGNALTKIFRIKEGNGWASGKAEVQTDVVIKKSNAGDVGTWYLSIWYNGYDSKASSKRTVIA